MAVSNGKISNPYFVNLEAAWKKVRVLELESGCLVKEEYFTGHIRPLILTKGRSAVFVGG
jgi:hypothetical protein